VTASGVFRVGDIHATDFEELLDRLAAIRMMQDEASDYVRYRGRHYVTRTPKPEYL
jgi:hypothetical protein